jgi:DNA-binding NarL/FixJ family response regulator
MTINIAIAEDNRSLALSLKEKLELSDNLRVKWHEPHGQALIDHLEQDHNLDVILMDINMPVRDGISATEEVKQRYPNIKVIMSTVFDEEQYILRAIMAGANGYLLKDERPALIHQAIEEVLAGGAPMSAAVANTALKLIRHSGTAATTENEHAVDYHFTPRETQILEQLATGLSYQQIAENLFISPGTVRKHIENIYQKLQVHNKVEAVQLALKNRLI